MRRMYDRLFTAAAAASALLLVAAVVLWVRSYRHCEQLGWERWTGGEAIDSRRGQASLTLTRSNFWSLHPAAYPFYEQSRGIQYGKGQVGAPGVRDRVLASYPGVRHHWHRFGFRWFVSSWESEGGRRLWCEVAFPYWLLVLALSFVPWRWGVRLRRRRRVRERLRRGLCFTCGYDLRATPKQGGILLDHCPECGGMRGMAALPTIG